jgi:SNF2 family DNA or RNA helicase
LGLTGTPMPHSPLDVWGQFHFLDRTIYDPTFGAFRLRYAKMGGYHNKVPVEWRDLDDLYAKFRSIAFQVDESALDLPDAIDETLECDLSPEGARIYREMEEDMVAWIRVTESQGIPVTAANSMVRLMRLQQITGGSLPNEYGEPVVVDRAKEGLLSDFLEDIGAEPVVVFAVYKADLARIHRAAGASQLASAEISGARDELEQWKRGKASVLAVQIQSGGEGIDLTRARLAVYFSHGFSLAQYKQSRARIWRPPQKRGVAIYHLQIRNSIDQYILRAVLARQDLVESVLKGLRKN